MEHVVKILMKEFVTHDTIRFITEKPENYNFLPGQTTEVSINQPGWKDKKRPFTFCSKNSDPVLEFTVKIYPHEGVTEQLSRLKPGDELIVRDVWGTINYKGLGVFIAGGAGITPFIAILRDLMDKGQAEGNMLLFANKAWKDIILEREFKEMLGNKAHFILSREEREGYDSGRIDEDYLKRHIKDFNQNFYLCGPTQFIVSVKRALDSLGASPESVVIEV